MSKIHPLLAPLVLAGFLFACKHDDDSETAESPPTQWQQPACSTIGGTGGVSFSIDGGFTRLPRRAGLYPNKYTWPIVALDTPNTLIAISDRSTTDTLAFKVLVSRDAGCSWQEKGSDINGFSHGQFYTAPNASHVIYTARIKATNEYTMWRIDVDGNRTQLNLPVMGIADAPVMNLKVDKNNPQHWRIAQFHSYEHPIIYDSVDGGQTWQALGTPPPRIGAVNTQISPINFDHIVRSAAGYEASGPLVSFDAGTTWLTGRIDGLTKPDTSQANFSPDGTKIWIVAREQGVYNGNPHRLYLSVDGGLNFSLAPGIGEHTLGTYGPGPIFVHPHDANVLYIKDAIMFSENGIFRYRHDKAELTWIPIPYSEGGVDAMAWHPLNPEWVYMTHSRYQPD